MGLRADFNRLLPPWMSSRGVALDKGFKRLYAWLFTVDGTIEAALQGMYARMPGTGTPSALRRIGNDRMIVRGPNEPDAAYDARLARWLIDWSKAGSARSILTQLWGYFTPFRPQLQTIADNQTRTVRHELLQDQTNPDASGAIVKTIYNPSVWNWDGNHNPILWARYWTLIIFTVSAGGDPFGDEGVWGNDPTYWGDGKVWGLDTTPDVISSIRQIVLTWQGGHNALSWIIIFTDLTGLALPDGTWGDWHKMSAGVAVPSRFGGGRYISPVGDNF